MKDGDLSSAGAPAAIGPYSQAVLRDGWLFASGQIGLDPSTGELVAGGIAAETERVLENLRAVLSAGGVGFESVVSARVYLTDMGDFSAFNQVYARILGHNRPARATVGVSALPRGARVEIEMVARARPEDQATDVPAV